MLKFRFLKNNGGNEAREENDMLRERVLIPVSQMGSRKNNIVNQMWWYIPVIQVPQEAESRGAHI